jgi:hypothetical protein
MRSTRTHGHVARRGLAVAIAAAFALALPIPGQAQAPAFDGRPAFREGRDFGYYVWRDGRTWHVRWTTRGVQHRFTGHVVAEGGRIDDLKRVDVEVERRVVRPGRAPHVVRDPRGRAHVAPGRGPVTATKVEDRVDMDDHKRIDFSARTDDDIDGFDFEAKDGVDALRFTLEIDGHSRVADVEVGSGNAHPAGNPFVVRLR